MMISLAGTNIYNSYGEGWDLWKSDYAVYSSKLV